MNQWLLSLLPIEEPEPQNVAVNNSYIEDFQGLTEHQSSGIEEAMNEWLMTGTLPGEGHDGIFALYERLRGLNLPLELMWEQLRTAARTARSPIERLKQVDRLMDNLKTYRSRYFTDNAA